MRIRMMWGYPYFRKPSFHPILIPYHPIIIPFHPILSHIIPYYPMSYSKHMGEKKGGSTSAHRRGGAGKGQVGRPKSVRSAALILGKDGYWSCCRWCPMVGEGWLSWFRTFLWIYIYIIYYIIYIHYIIYIYIIYINICIYIYIILYIYYIT